MNIRCPNCNELFEVETDAFGKTFLCKNCNMNFKLDTMHLAKFILPREIQLQLVDTKHIFNTLANIAVIFEYGYIMGPIYSDTNGVVSVNRDIFHQVENDMICSGIMDHKGDYSLNRFVFINIPTNDELKKLLTKRIDGNWSLTTFEKEFYKGEKGLKEAYLCNNNANYNPIRISIDLKSYVDVLKLKLEL